MNFSASVELTVIPRARLRNTASRTQVSTIPDVSTASGVVLDHGRPGAATVNSEIVGGNRYWSWDWAAVNTGATKWQPQGKTQVLAPSAREGDSSTNDKTPTPDQVQQSMQAFIASLVDTADHGAILEIAEDELQAMNNKPVCDPFSGLTLERVQDHRDEGRWSVAYPVGAAGNELSFSPLSGTPLPSKHRSSKEDALKQTRLEFPTEILQLRHSPARLANQHRHLNGLLFVRLHSSVRVVQLAMTNSSGHPFHATEIASAGTSRFRGRRPMDVAADPDDWGRAVVIDDLGAVWSWEMSVISGELEDNLHCIREAVSAEPSGPYRVAHGTQMDTAIVASSSSIDILEVKRASTSPLRLYSAPTDSRIVALEPTSSARSSLWTCICTTETIMWLDERKPGRPALSWLHSRGPDPTLSIVACDAGGDVCRYILWSRQSPLITVYTISKTHPARSLCDPYLIALPKLPAHLKLHSITWAPSSGVGQAHELLLLCNTGALLSISLSTVDSRDNRMGEQLDGLVALDNDVKGPSLANQSDKDCKRYQVANFERAWREINTAPTGASFQAMVDVEATAAKGGPIISGVDVVVDGLELTAVPRSTFLKTAAVSDTDITPALQHIEAALQLPDFTRIDMSHAIETMIGVDVSNSGLADHLQRTYFPLNVDSADRDPKLLDKQQSAVQLLARDLKLANSIVSARSIKQPVIPTPQEPPTNPEDLFERVAHALSLHEAGPSPIEFTFLERPEHAGLENTTVQALMMEWTLGDDPSTYAWTPPSKVSAPAPGSPALERPTRAMPQSSPFARPRSPMLHSQPTFSLARSESLGGMRNTLWPREQGPLSWGRPAASLTQGENESESQTFGGAQTQVLAGPFGGRSAPKKKPKKRVAGF